MGSSADKRPLSRPDGSRLRRTVACTALIGAACAVAALAPAEPAAAQSLTELTSKTDDARHQAEILAGEIEAQSGALAAKQEQAGAAAAREAQLSSTLEVGRERAAELATAFGEARGRLREARADLRRSVALLADRMVAIYKAGGADAVELLLSSDGYDDLVTRTEYFERIRAADAALIERARDLRAEVNRQLDAVAAAREEQETYNAQVSAARDQIAAVRAQAESRAAALASASRSREDTLAELRPRSGAGSARSRRPSASPPPRPSSRSPTGSRGGRSPSRSCSASPAATSMR